MKNKYILILFFSLIVIVLSVNIIAFFKGIYGTSLGQYISVFNITILGIETLLYKYLNKPFKKK